MKNKFIRIYSLSERTNLSAAAEAHWYPEGSGQALARYPYFYTMICISFIFLLPSTHSFGQSIFDLARTGDVVAMQKLLDAQPNQVNQLPEQILSPFLLSTYRGNNAVAKLLTDYGADIHTCYSEESAIYGVIYKNNIEILDFMLQKGLNVNDTCQFTKFGATSHFAMSLRRYDIIERFLEHHAGIKMTD